MFSESDPLQLQPQTPDSSPVRPPVHGRRPSLFEWGSKISQEQNEFDAKTIAARRKRSEIRRLKLMAVLREELLEPPLKRSKGVSKAVSGPRGYSSSVSGSLKGCKPDDITGAFISSVDASATNVVTTCISVSQERSSSDGENRELIMRGRLASPVSDAACPSHCVVSICGRSRVMEDAAIAVPSFLSMPSSVVGCGGSAHADTFHFYGVYDGHGGPQASQICKERMHGMLAKEMSEAAYSSPSQLEACMENSFRRLDDELCGVCPHESGCPHKLDAGITSSSSSCREPLVPGSVGTTAVVAVVGGNHIVVGNCGDSRAVLSRGGEAVPLSVDHKANRPDEVARIEAEGGQVFTWEGHRVFGVLAMSRALGDGFLKPFVSGQPEVTITERTDDDECLILASDGLWDVLSSKYVCSVARKAMANWRRQHTKFQLGYPMFAHYSKEHQLSDDVDAEDSPAQVVAAILVKLALARNSKDNISVVVVDLKRQ